MMTSVSPLEQNDDVDACGCAGVGGQGTGWWVCLPPGPRGSEKYLKPKKAHMVGVLAGP